MRLRKDTDHNAVGLAMIESLAIYALVIALILLYANPLIKYIAG